MFDNVPRRRRDGWHTRVGFLTWGQARLMLMMWVLVRIANAVMEKAWESGCEPWSGPGRAISGQTQSWVSLPRRVGGSRGQAQDELSQDRHRHRAGCPRPEQAASPALWSHSRSLGHGLLGTTTILGCPPSSGPGLTCELVQWMKMPKCDVLGSVLGAQKRSHPAVCL